MRRQGERPEGGGEGGLKAKEGAMGGDVRERKKEGAVVLRSVWMSAFPLSGEGAHRLSVSVTPLVYASLSRRGKGR